MFVYGIWAEQSCSLFAIPEVLPLVTNSLRRKGGIMDGEREEEEEERDGEEGKTRRR